MEIHDIVCSKETREKLARKHQISLSEVHEVLWGNPEIRFHEKGRIQGENLYIAYGRTEAGRYLKVFFIHKKNQAALIVTAKDMSAKEKRRYGKKN